MYQAVFVLGSLLLVRLCRANSEIDVCPYRCDPFYTAISRLTVASSLVNIRILSNMNNYWLGRGCCTGNTTSAATLMIGTAGLQVNIQ